MKSSAMFFPLKGLLHLKKEEDLGDKLTAYRRIGILRKIFDIAFLRTPMFGAMFASGMRVLVDDTMCFFQMQQFYKLS